MPLHAPVPAAVLEPRYSFVKQVTKNWTGNFEISGIYGISFDETGNFWFWTRVSDYETRLYKLNWATGVITEEVIWDTDTVKHWVRGMIILSTGEIYSLVTAYPASWWNKWRLVYCGTVSSPAIPDLDNYIWTEEGMPVIDVDIRDIFKDQNDDIFGYDYHYDRYIKRTGITTYSNVCPTGYRWPNDVSRSIKVNSTIYVKGEYAFYCIKNPSASLAKQDVLELGWADLLNVNGAGIAYNPSDGKVYLVYEQTIYPGLGEETDVLAFAELSLMA